MSKKTLLKQVLFGRIQRYIWLCLFLVAFSFLSTFFKSPPKAEAATSGTMNFQARLLQSSGALVPDGYYNVEFKLYNAASSAPGTELWTETYKQGNRVRVSNGYLTVNLGAITEFSSNINWDQEHWLTMNIGGTANVVNPSWDGEMTPRLKLTAVPYAFTAGKLQKTNSGNTSTLDFISPTGSRNIWVPDESGTICLQGSANCGFATGSAANYLQNGSAPQAASFNITGSGTVGGNLTVNGGADFDGVTTFFQSTPTSSPTVFIQGGDGQTSDLLYLSDFDSNNSLSVTKDAMLKIVSNLGSTNILTSRVTIAGSNKFEINANGQLSWGDGLSSTDTNLYRGGANLLKTDDTFDAAAFSVGGTAGISATCSAGQVLQDQVIVGGIVTGGTCVSNGASSLQTAYEGGNSILTGDARDISFTLADTAIDSNFLVNVASGSTGKFAVQNNGTDTFSVGATGNVLSKTTVNSTNAFEVQNADGDSLLNIDTANNVITLGGNNSGELQQWQSTTTLPNLRWFSTSAVANGYVYVIGGAQASGDPRDTVYYAKFNSDGTVGSWVESTNALPTNLQAHSTVTTNGYIYVIGGNNGSGATTNVYGAKLHSDGSTGPWYPLSPIGAGSFWHKTVVANGYIYGMGGYSGSTTYNEVVRAKVNSDGTLGAWTPLDDLPTPLHSFGTVVANGYIYIIGGYTGGEYSDDVHYAKINSDGSLGSWNTDTDVLPAARTSLQSVVMNGYVYAIGGNDSTNTVRNEVYYAKLNRDGGTGPWQTATNGLPEVRNQATAVTNNGYVYLIGGRGPAITPTPTNTVYYTSGQRLMVGGSLDLVGLSDSNLADGGDGGSLGGSLTAGNTNIIGTLQVRGDSSFAQSVNVGGNLNLTGNFTLQNGVNSTHAFQVQDAGANTLFNIDTQNSLVTVAQDGYLMFGNSAGISSDSVNDDLRIFNDEGGVYFQTDYFTFQDTEGYHNNFVINNTGAAIFSNRVDQVNGFQVQNSTGDTLLNGDTENMRVGIGTNTPREALHVMGPDTANNGGKGRIVIGDYCHEDDVTCTESGSNVFIGEYYVRGSTNFEDIDTDTLQMQGKLGLLFTTGIEADKINLEITGNGSARFQNTTDSTTAFRIQRSVSAGGGNVLTADTTNNRVLIGSATSPTLSSAQLVVTVAEVQSTLRVGNATNGISFNDTATGESGKLRLYGTARNTKKITLSPEYAGAVLSGTGIGSMTSGVDWSAGKNYYRWTSTQSTLQWYEIVIAVPLPSDWSEWAPGTAAMSIETWRPDGGGQGEIRVYDTNGDEDFYVDDIDDVYNTWVPYNFDLSNTGYVADGKMYIRVALGAENSSSFQIGDITLTYLSKY